MLRDVPKMLEITRRVVRAVSLPVTVKTRLGWDCENTIITDLGPRLQDCGIQAITVHGRPRSQMYTGEADWTLIGELKADPRLAIPVIGNGDITTPEGAADAFRRYGAAGVMVGRASFGAPWLLRAMRQFLDFAGGRPIIAHNADFDTGFMSAACRRAGIPFEPVYLDTLVLAQYLLPDLKSILTLL